MKRILLLAVCALVSAGHAHAGTGKAPRSLTGVPVIEQHPIDVTRLEREVTDLASRERGSGKRLLLYFQASWCGPCRIVHRAFERERNRGTFQSWVLVPIDVDLLPEGPILGLDFDQIPYFIKLDDRGRPSGTLDGYRMGDLMNPGKVDAAFRNFLGS